MKIFKGKIMKKATAFLLAVVMVLSAFAVLPADLFKAEAANVTTTMYEELQKMTDDLLGGGSSAGGSVEYNRYAAISKNYEVTNGEYVVTVSGNVITHGFQVTGTATTTSDTWFFAKQSSGKYYIYYANGQYLNINGSGLSVTGNPQELVVRATSAGAVTIGDGSGNYINYSGNTVGADAVATSLTLHTVTRTESGPTITKELVKQTSITSGEKYVVTIKDGTVMTSNTNGDGHLMFSGTATVDSETWTFTASGSEYFIQTSNGRYLVKDSGSTWPVLSSSSGTMACSFSGDVLSITFKNGCDTMHVQKDSNNLVSSTTGTGDHTSFYIYKVVETSTPTEAKVEIAQFIPTIATDVPPVENGRYIIFNPNYILSATTTTVANNYGVERIAATPANNKITAERANEYMFTLSSGNNRYYIQNQYGQYMSIGTSDGSLTFTDTPTEVTVYGRTDGDVVIYNGSQLIQNNNTNSLFTTVNRAFESAYATEILRLYKNPLNVEIPEGKAELYAALVSGLKHNPRPYTRESYQQLYEALVDGYDIFNNDQATPATALNAAQRIRTAINNLEEDFKKFPATVYKYGYNPSATGDSRYTGGASINTQTYAAMEEKIKADDNLMSQIKNAIDYDTRNWSNAAQADTALNTAVAAYAKIYSLSFTGYPRAGTGVTEVTDFQKTAWNIWTKTDTTGSKDSRDEGASVQGLFSALLTDGHPTDHAIYREPLSYGNIADFYNGYFDTSNGISITFTAGTASASVTLPALEGISVHTNDLFVKEDVLATGSSTNYSKYYWDFDFPFMTETNEYGINTYSYSSSSNDYIFRASYNDAEHTANATLYPITTDQWSITKAGTLQEGANTTGFFPFNYQLNKTDQNKENAIYHYGMNFSTDFYIPVSGTYTDGEDIEFKFSGDDDVLVYIDDVLVLDNGGLHGARGATINFTDMSVNYQYAIDVTEGTVKNKTEYGTTYTYGENVDSYNGDTLAALEKLYQVRHDGNYHTFTFYYLERGSTDSNCEISFNMQQASEHVLLNDETVVVDYGLPVEYNVRHNDYIDEAVSDIEYDYLGLVYGNTEVPSVVLFAEPNNLVSEFKSANDVLTVPGLKYGNATMRDDGLVTYTPNTLHMTGKDFFYSCAAITGDPTYDYDTVYYQYDRATFIPATTIYYEDNFDKELISFNDGSTTNGSDDGKWQTVGDASKFADAKQAADLVGDLMANPYGYDPIYADTDDEDSKYSGFSAQMVTVSAANNTSKGGTNPTVKFDFTGTGFDVISVTDNTTGVFYVEIFDENGNQVGKRRVVDTYYGYDYGQLYADEEGNATLEVTDKPLYKSAVNEAVTVDPTYYSVDGTGYTSQPTYYDVNGNLTETETDNPAYAYAFSWVASSEARGLYQIPVIKINGLDYGKYSVVITPMYTAMFDHNITDGIDEFNLYVDAIRIYNPANMDTEDGHSILIDYRYDNEAYPNYLELKDMLIGADSLSKDSAKQGVIFIDGIAALDNDLEKLKLAGPNNELYLAQGQAVAFEIWASEIPDGVQLGVKSAQGKPSFKLTYGDNSDEMVVASATEMNYVLNSMLPDDGQLKWTKVEVNGTPYYTTGTVVIQNTANDSSILSLTSVKWTFTGAGQYGHHEISATENVAEVSLMSTDATVASAYRMMRSSNVVLPDDDGVNDVLPDDDGNDNNNDESTSSVSWFQKLVNVVNKIFDFFKNLFNWRA